MAGKQSLYIFAYIECVFVYVCVCVDDIVAVSVCVQKNHILHPFEWIHLEIGAIATTKRPNMKWWK